MSITLKQARIIVEASIAKGRELDLKPLSVVILDPRTSLVACNSEEGVSQMRWRIAQGKANAAIQLGMGSRALMVRRTTNIFHTINERPCWGEFFQSLVVFLYVMLMAIFWVPLAFPAILLIMMKLPPLLVFLRAGLVAETG